VAALLRDLEDFISVAQAKSNEKTSQRSQGAVRKKQAMTPRSILKTRKFTVDSKDAQPPAPSVLDLP
jgi:hypothetical protein